MFCFSSSRNSTQAKNEGVNGLFCRWAQKIPWGE